MLDLHARVHFDEVKGVCVHIHQEFDGACAFIVRVCRNLQAKTVDLGALRFGQIGRGRTLDDLLIAPLDRAIAFIEVVKHPVLVAEDLHFHMAGLENQLLQIALAIAERGLGLTPAFLDFVFQLVRTHDRAHPATATTPGGFQHQRVADLVGHGADLVHGAGGFGVGQDFGRRNDRHIRFNRCPPGRGLVAQHPHRLSLGTDEGDPGTGAGVHEVRVLGQQPVAGVDRIGTGLQRNTDDLVNREIRLDRSKTRPDLIGLVCLEAMETQLVLLGIDGDSGFAELVGGTADPDGNFTPVCDQDLLERGHLRLPLQFPRCGIAAG